MIESAGRYTLLVATEDTIFLTLGGYGELLSASAFTQALQAFLGLLEDLDATLSHDRHGTVDWEIVMLSKSSPARIGFIGKPRPKKQDISRDIGIECVRGVRLLGEKAERGPTYSDAALSKTQRLAHLREKAFSTIDIQTPNDEARVTLEVYQNIDVLTKGTEEEEASIVGNLDSITIHRGNEFRVWDERTKKAVRCMFRQDLLEKAKNSLGKRVMVIGMSRINRLGQVIRVDAADIETYPSDAELPTIKQMSGSIENITAGMPLREYIKHLRDE